ncbi:hypothetical protein Rhow_008061 [Rhodococcus wratislaviensis]|uniref:Uncharacterized protein n=1 Tax=Rhodococcus wratislaviensis TaxID=44752 RepID=A0A402CJI2_RHOWR|nr:hypothetical protein [Rhodococcus wratislaviensis]GCE43763.1 hypothetical protein Rhow_008061 [Rhodococcus wratislaviensis]
MSTPTRSPARNGTWSGLHGPDPAAGPRGDTRPPPVCRLSARPEVVEFGGR